MLSNRQTIYIYIMRLLSEILYCLSRIICSTLLLFFQGQADLHAFLDLDLHDFFPV